MKSIQNLKKKIEHIDQSEKFAFFRDLFIKEQYFELYCLLENELSYKFEYKTESFSEIYLDLIFAKVLVHYDCSIVPLNIINKATNAIIYAKTIPDEKKASLLLLSLTIYFDLSMHDEVLLFSKSILNNIDNLTQYQLQQINVIVALAKLLQGTNSLADLKSELETCPDQSFRSYIEYSILYFSWEYDEDSSENIIIKCKDFISTYPKFAFMAHLLIAEIYRHECYFKKSLDYINKNIDVVKLRNLRKVYFQRYLSIQSVCVRGGDLLDDLMFRSFPMKSYLDYSVLDQHFFTFLAENKFPPKTLGRKRHYNSTCYYFENNSKSMVWKIDTNGEFRIVKYNTIIDFDNYLDLNSGIIKRNNKLYILSKYRTILLYCIITSGHQGVSEIFLVEQVFKDENLNLKSAILRIRDLITQLQKLNIPIIRKDKITYFDFENRETSLVLPLRYHFEDEHNYFFIFVGMEVFDWSRIASVLQVKRATAFNLIKKWHEAGLIKKVANMKGMWRRSQI